MRKSKVNYTVKVKNECHKDDCVELTIHISKEAWQKLQEKNCDVLNRLVLISL